MNETAKPTSIKVSCPSCGKEIVVAIKTIDSLREKLRSMENERNIYRDRLHALELKNATKPKFDITDILGGL